MASFSSWSSKGANFCFSRVCCFRKAGYSHHATENLNYQLCPRCLPEYTLQYPWSIFTKPEEAQSNTGLRFCLQAPPYQQLSVYADKPADCFQGFRTAHDYVSSHASECMWTNISIHLLLIQIYMYVVMKTKKNCACKGVSSAQGFYLNCLMKSLENSNVLLSLLSLVALVLLKIWFRGLKGLVQCQRVHYLFSSQVSITC